MSTVPLFVANQILYTADPIIQGAPDPIPQRTGWKDGQSRVVVLPALTPAQPRQARAAPTGPRKQGSAGTARVTGGASASLAEMGDGAGKRGFHAPLLAETMRYAGRCAAGTGTRDDDAEVNRLRGAVLAAPCGESRSPEPVDTYASDDCLRGLIESAFDRVADDQASATAIKPQYPIRFSQPTHCKLVSPSGIQGSIRTILDDHALPGDLRWSHQGLFDVGHDRS